MEINDQAQMAKFLKAVIEGEDSDEVFERVDKLKLGPCVVNTFSIQDTITGKSYLVSVKLVK